MLCHLEQLLLVTHLDLSHNRLRALPPALAALRCLEVKPPILCHCSGFSFLPQRFSYLLLLMCPCEYIVTHANVWASYHIPQFISYLSKSCWPLVS